MQKQKPLPVRVAVFYYVFTEVGGVGESLSAPSCYTLFYSYSTSATFSSPMATRRADNSRTLGVTDHSRGALTIRPLSVKRMYTGRSPVLYFTML